MNERQLMPIGTEIEVYSDDDADSMPIYSGDVESAFMDLMPGHYTAGIKYVDNEPAFAWLLIVTADESFAVSTAVTTYSIRLFEDQD